MFLCIDNKNLFSSHHVIFVHYDVAELYFFLDINVWFIRPVSYISSNTTYGHLFWDINFEFVLTKVAENSFICVVLNFLILVYTNANHLVVNAFSAVDSCDLVDI